MKVDFFTLSGNKMTGHGTVSHNSAIEKKAATMPSAHETMKAVFWDAEGCLQAKFMPQQETSLLLVTFGQSRSFSVLGVTNFQVRGIYSCDMTTHGTTLLICTWRGFRTMAGDVSLPSTMHPGSGSLRPPSLWVCKGSDARPALYDQ
jgi:hypothetical protein